MSIDKEVTKDLMELLEDSSEGFSHAAEKLAETDRSDLASKFSEHAEQRSAFYRELELLAAEYGDDVDEDGSVKAAAHRMWLSVKDAVSGSDPDGVLDAAVQGEEHAVESYDEALGKDISAGLRSVVERQAEMVRRSHADVVALQEAHS